jgi:Tat protein translocase TatB subunit
MLGMGWGEIGFVLVIALIVLGPEKLPAVARTLGKGVRMLRKATNDLRRAVEIEGVRDDIRAQLEGVKSSIPDPYAAVRAEEQAWSSNSKGTSAPDHAPPGSVSAGFGEEPDPVWELTEHVTVAPVSFADAPLEAVSVPMVAVPVKVLGDLKTVPLWGGVHGLKEWLDRPRELGPARDVYPEVVAMELPRPVFRRAAGVVFDSVPLPAVAVAGLIRVTLPVRAPASEPHEHKEAS